ncbi:MAG: multi-sensor hybrid histidine kinase [Rhodocyclaceae bacterium]|nr:multi-sensor hybrid histidine kinase [Rhodocyclaceae bacterium]
MSEGEPAEAALRQEKQFSDDIINSLPGIFYMLDTDGRYVHWNQRLCEVSGYRAEELARMRMFQLFGDDTAPLLLERIEEVFRTGESEMEAPLLTKDGRCIPYRFTGRRTTIGGRSYLVGLGIDISQRKAAEAQVERLNRERTAELAETKLLQSISAALIHQDHVEGLYQEIIDAAVAIMGSDCASMQVLYPERGEGGELRLLAHRGFSPEAAKFWEWVRADSRTTCGIALGTGRRAVAPDTENCHSMAGSEDLATAQQSGIRAMQSTPLVSRGGRMLGMISTHWRHPHQPSEQDFRLLDILARQAADLLERRQAEAQIQLLNATLEERVRERTAELEAANRELEGFTYAASHDMRAPLGRINSFSTLLSDKYRDRLDGDGLLFLDLIRQNATRLNILVEDLLAHAQIGQHNWDMRPTGVEGAVKVILHERSEDIRQSGADIRLDFPGPMSVNSNPTALHQILRNLVDNALKYSRQAQPPVIDIGGRVEQERCLLWVRDNGIGIDPVYHEKIFQIFQRLHTYSEYPGNGIGLALVRKAVERLNGRVRVESEPGRGATFLLELPV